MTTTPSPSRSHSFSQIQYLADYRTATGTRDRAFVIYAATLAEAITAAQRRCSAMGWTFLAVRRPD